MYAPIDGTVPAGYPIKGQQSMMLYYPKGAKFYSRVVADVYFDTEEAAEHAGFTRWDRRGSAAHVIRPNADD
jgi:large subunit ribosomal protein L17